VTKFKLFFKKPLLRTILYLVFSILLWISLVIEASILIINALMLLGCCILYGLASLKKQPSELPTDKQSLINPPGTSAAAAAPAYRNSAFGNSAYVNQAIVAAGTYAVNNPQVVAYAATSAATYAANNPQAWQYDDDVTNPFGYTGPTAVEKNSAP